MIKPGMLRPGDTVAAVSLSWGGPGAYPHRYDAGKKQLEEMFGIRVVESRHALRSPDWLERHPDARADDLMESFADRSIAAIISTIGGDDSIRLLRHLDLALLRSNPKIFLGYSDSTVIHLACHRAGLVSFYGPSIMAGFGESGGIPPYLAESVRRALFSSDPIGVLAPAGEWTAEFQDWADPKSQAVARRMQPSHGWRWLQGERAASGRLIGGCMEVLEFLRGTDFWPAADAFDGAVLFIETSEEAPPPALLARVLRTYAAMGLLQKVAALLFGRPGGNVPVATFDDYDAAILKVVRDEEGLTGLPIVSCMDFGHTDPMFVLPYGVTATVDPAGRRFEIVENAVEPSATWSTQ